MRNNRIGIYVGIIIGIAIVIAVIVFLSTQVMDSTSSSPKMDEPGDLPKITNTNETAKNMPEKVTHEASLLAVGDILIHKRVYDKAKTADSYDFKPNLKAVKPYIQQADLAVANSETIIGGEDIGLSTYPSFNSPYEVGDALKWSGVDVVTMANNHTLDRGIPAIKNAIHYWDKIGITHTGSFLSETARNTIQTVTKNDIKFSFLSYTYGTNGIPTPDGKDYLVNRIDPDLITKDIKAVRKQSDVVVVALHFGEQYERMPNAGQKKLVKTCADAGADVILGSHPHVLQPTAWVDGKGGHRTFVIYSLGNFLSGQDDSLYKELGGMMQVTAVKTVQGRKSSVKITDPRFKTTWVDPETYQVYPIEAAAEHGLDNAKQIQADMQDHMKQWMPRLKFELAQ